MCTPNPIIPASGEKSFYASDVDDRAVHPLTFERKYRTAWRIAPQSQMGVMWAHNHAANLRQDIADSSGNTLILQLGDGSQRWFQRASDTAAWTNASHADRLVAATSADGAAAWRYTRASDDSQWLFTQPTTNAHGTLQSQRQRNGWTYTYSYNALGQLVQVRNHFNRALTLTYHAGSGLLASVTGPDGQTTQYTWDANDRLTLVTHPGGTQLRYHHEDSRFPQYITGITDENGKRFQTVDHDALGRATVSTLAGDAERYVVNYPDEGADLNTAATITDPIGTARHYGYAQTNGRTAVVSGSNLPGCKGEPPVVTRTQFPQGLLESETDFLGNVTRYNWNTDRQLITAITRAADQPEQQVTTIDWHPTLAVPTLITEPLRTTRDDLDDAGRLLKRTVTHTGGASSGKVQITQFAYTAAGLLASRTEPNGAVTVFANHNAAGLPQTITNALGHVTTVVYDAAGRPTQITQPNGLVRALSYSPRGWLLSNSETAAGVTLTTVFAYTPSGQVQSVVRPNGHAVSYQHDDAQRVIGWSDNRGQNAAYALDGLGNVTAEHIKNDGGTTALAISRSVNAINRLSSQTLGSDISTTYSYDANGRLQAITDAAHFTTQIGLDALARVTRITDALGKVATYSYDAQNALTGATDFKGVTTAYAPDAQGLPASESSPDIGNRSSTFDAMNLPTGVTDAMGRATTMARDALGRPTLITQSQSGFPTLTTELRYDLNGSDCNASGHASASKGRLCEVITRSGGVEQTITRHQWDSFGRPTRHTQILAPATASHHQTRTTVYTYHANGAGRGELATITYPSSAVLAHQYNASGQLSGMLWNGQPLIENLRFDALGLPLSWTWAFADASSATAVAASRSHDSAGLLRTSEFATFTPNNLGHYVAIAQGLYQRDANGVWVLENVPHTATYDALGRLTALSATGTSAAHKRALSYGWDDNGNRLLGTYTEDGVLRCSSASTVASGSNWLLSLADTPQALNAAGEHTRLGKLALAYDSAGRLSVTTQAEPGMPVETTTHVYNGQHQRVLRENTQGQTVYVYGLDGHNLLGEYRSPDAVSPSGSTEHIWLPTASGPMPIATVINGEHFAVHADHLNTPRRLTDRNGNARWQWAYSGFGELPAQSLTTATLPEVHYHLRYPGQVDDGNGLFYNWHRFYHPQTGRYTQVDPIGLEGGWNRFIYVGNRPLSFNDPDGLTPLASAFTGAWLGSALGPVGMVVGGLAGFGAGAWIGWNYVGPMLAKPPENAYDPDGPKAPGKPGKAENFKDPKGGENWVPNPNPGRGGSSWGWQDADGDVWCPSGQGGRSHGGPHWDVQTPGGGYRNVRPRR